MSMYSFKGNFKNVESAGRLFISLPLQIDGSIKPMTLWVSIGSVGITA